MTDRDGVDVLHVVPSLRIGGAETMATTLAVETARRGVRVAVATLYGAYGTPLERRLSDGNVPVYHLGKRRGPDPRMFGRFWKLIRRVRPGVVHSHSAVLVYAAPTIACSGRIRWIHTMHSVADREVPALPRFVQRALFRSRVRVVAIAHGVRRSVEAVYGIQCAAVIPNGILTDTHCHAPRIEDTRGAAAPSPVVITCVAGLRPEKNHLQLLRAIARAGTVGTCVLHLVGAGPMEGILRGEVARLGLEGQVRFLGERPDVPAILHRSHVFALTSAYEGSPLAVIEAMAAGLPVIAAAVGGIPELIDDAVEGYLIPAGDDALLAERLQALVASERLRREMGNQARARAVRCFRSEEMADRYLALYRVQNQRLSETA